MQNTVSMKVAEQITSLGPKVEDKVVDAMVSRELVKRSDALVQVMDKLAKEERDFRRFGADVIAYDEKGEKVSETFSKARLDERAKAQKKLDKMTGAITRALEKGEFQDVYNFASGKEPTAEADKPAAEDSSES